MDVLNEIKNLRLSPLLIVTVITTTALALPRSARGETTESSSSTAEMTSQTGESIATEFYENNENLFADASEIEASNLKNWSEIDSSTLQIASPEISLEAPAIARSTFEPQAIESLNANNTERQASSEESSFTVVAIEDNLVAEAIESPAISQFQDSSDFQRQTTDTEAIPALEETSPDEQPSAPPPESSEPPETPTLDAQPSTPEEAPTPPPASEAEPSAPEPSEPPETQSPTSPEEVPTPPPATETEPPTLEESPTSPPESSEPPETQSPTSPEESPSSETPPAEEARVLVAEVLISGANQELENLVYNTIRTEPGRTATRTQLQEDVNAIYATGYFANVRVTPEDTPLGVRVTFAVRMNPILQGVQIETVPDPDKQVLPAEVIQETFSEQYGKILNLRDLQDGIKQLNEWYSENGYDLAQVVGSPRVSNDGTVTLVIAEGLIEDISVRFFNEEDEPVDGKTRDFIVTREMELKPGDVFNRNTAQQDLQRVFGLGIFQDARLSFEPGSDPRKVVVNVDIVEGNTGSLAVGAGISSNSGFFGTLSYQEQNLGGNNQTLGAELQVGERELLFDVSFTDPWIGGDPFRTSYTINGFRRRSISLVYDGDDTSIRTANGDDSPRVVRTGGGITFVRPLAKDPYTKPEWRLSAGFQYQRVQIENADGDISPVSRPEDGSELLAFDSSGKDDLFIFSFGASRDLRDNPLQPTSGSVLRLSVDQTAPFGSGSILFTRLRGSYSYYLPVRWLNFDFDETSRGPQVLAFNVQAGTILGDLPPYEAFVIGGSNSVRGYAEGELGSGRSYVQATAEYRFPIISIVGGALFVDYGTTLGTGDNVPGSPSEVRGLPGSGLGYGVGVRIQSPVGPIRIDYGFNDRGDSRLHFGLGERF